MSNMSNYNNMKPLYTKREFKDSTSRHLLPLQCLYCNKTFFRSKHFIQIATWYKQKGRKYSADFCSIQCHNLLICPPTIIICDQCGKSRNKKKSDVYKTKHNFCCQSCAASWQNHHKIKGTRVSKLEKWIARKLRKPYPNLKTRFNHKRAIGSELDIYIPALKLAFELNGIFHYDPIYGVNKLNKVRINDNRKLQECIKRNIELFVINTSCQKRFKEQTSQPFLTTIGNIIDSRLLKIGGSSENRTPAKGSTIPRSTTKLMTLIGSGRWYYPTFSGL